MKRIITILFLGLLLTPYSCKKDSPAGYPTVTISSPYSMEYFNIPGTIHVAGHASDSKTLTSLSVNITNSRNQSLEQTVLIAVTSNNMDFTCDYLLNDIHMPSGQYYLTVTASNGTNLESAFQEIYIDALPTRRIAIYAVTRNSSGVHAWGIDTTFKVSPLISYTLSSDYSSSDVNSWYQQFYIAAHDSGNMNVQAVPNLATDWSVPGNIAPAPYFTNVYCNVDAEFVSYYLGYVKCFNHNGVFQSEYNSPSGYYPIKTFEWNGWLFAEEKNIASPTEYLWSYYQPTTAPYQQTPLGGPMVAMYGSDNNDIFVFGNNTSGGAYMQLYNINSNLFFSPISLNAYGQLLSVAQVNENTYLMSFSDGKIYQYTYNPNSIVPYINGITASKVKYDSISNQVITASANIVNAYNYSFTTATLVNSVIISDTVRDVRVLYNK